MKAIHASKVLLTATVIGALFAGCERREEAAVGAADPAATTTTSSAVNETPPMAADNAIPPATTPPAGMPPATTGETVVGNPEAPAAIAPTAETPAATAPGADASAGTSGTEAAAGTTVAGTATQVGATESSSPGSDPAPDKVQAPIRESSGASAAGQEMPATAENREGERTTVAAAGERADAQAGNIESQSSQMMNNAESSASRAATSAGNVIDDTVITGKIKAALLADESVKGLDINVETQQKEVLLSGFVEDQSQVDNAVRIAENIDGVAKVNNKLVVQKEGGESSGTR